MTHAIIRTSPTGNGEKFIGTCTKCGMPNLPMKAALQYCPADGVVSDSEALLHIIKTDAALDSKGE